MPSHIVRVILAEKDLTSLKANRFKLCIAKKVNGEYNVIWQALDFFEYSVIIWEEEYQVFGMKPLGEGMRVRDVTRTAPVPITLGQSVTINMTPIMQPAIGSPTDGGSFIVNNDYTGGAICVGVGGIVNGSMFPLYASNQVPFNTSLKLTLHPPGEGVRVLLWFSPDVETGQKFTKDVTTSKFIEVDFTVIRDQTLHYVAGDWSFGSGIESSATYQDSSGAQCLNKEES